MSEASQQPIFIIGSPRSGTTLLRLLLDSHPSISCGPESHILTQMQAVVGSHWAAFELYNPDKEHWHRKIAAFFDGFKREYAEARGKRRWADKSPPYTLMAEFVDQLFPRAQYLHIIRDGRDVVASHRKRWGLRTGLRSIDRWRQFVEKARSFGRTIEPSRYHELRYEELVAEPERVMRGVLEFLGEPWVPEILDYERFEHDVPGPQVEHAAAERKNDGERTIYRSRVGVGNSGMGPLLSLVFNAKNRALSRELGYG